MLIFHFDILGAAKTKHFANAVCSLKYTWDSPHGLFGVDIDVTDKIHTILSTAKKNVSPIYWSSRIIPFTHCYFERVLRC